MSDNLQKSMLECANALIAGRRSVRAYLPRQVERGTIDRIIALARHAPSGSNTQPWLVYIVTGARQQKIIGRLCEAFNATDSSSQYYEEYDYYPKEWQSPYLERRRKVGWDLYGLLGIRKDEKEKIHVQHQRNVEFFGAPVSIFFTIDKIMGQGSWLDYGMFIQNVMLAARAYGLATCPQAAINPYHEILRAELGWPNNEMLVCSMSMGYEDPDALVNSLQTERAPVDSLLKYLD